MLNTRPSAALCLVLLCTACPAAARQPGATPASQPSAQPGPASQPVALGQATAQPGQALGAQPGQAPGAQPGQALGAQPGQATAQPAQSPGARPGQAPGAQPGRSPFAALRVVTPPDKLPPLRSVRGRGLREQQDRSREGTITVTVNARPRHVAVYYGNKLLGTTPLTLTAPRGSTPLDVVLKRKGYMTLHTRLRRKTDRSYLFKMTPAKIR